MTKIGQRTRRLRGGITLAVVAAALAALAYLLRHVDWHMILQVGGASLAAILLLTILETFLYVVLIHWLVRRAGYHAGLWPAYLVLTTSLSANYVSAIRAGIPLRVFLYHKLMQLPAALGTALVAVESFAGMITPALIAAAGVIFLFPEIGVTAPLALTGLIGAAALAFCLMTPARLLDFHQRWRRRRWMAHLVHFLYRVRLGVGSLSSAAIAGTMGFFAVMLLVQAWRLQVLLAVFVPAPPLWTLLAVLTIAATLGNASMIPMGLGVRDAGFAWLLLHVGIPQDIALSATIIQRLFAPGWPLLLGLISAQILSVRTVLSSRPAGSAPTHQPSAGPT